MNAVVARSERAAVALASLTAYPNGFELEFDIRLRDHDLAQLIHGAPPWLYGRLEGSPRPDEALPDELLRYGIEFPDGSKATSLDEPPFPPPGDEREPSPPVLVPRGGGGGEARWDQRVWVWPLPPPGGVRVVWEWPIAGIPLTRFELEGDSIRRSAERAVVLWEDGGPLSGGGTVGMLQID